MLILLAIPVIVAVTFVQRLIQVVAPSNLLVRGVRSARPNAHVAFALLGLAAVLFLTMHVVAGAVSAGAPGWLNLVVLVLAWDAFNVAWLAAGVILWRTVGVARRFVGRASHVPQPTPCTSNRTTTTSSSGRSRRTRRHSAVGGFRPRV